MDESPDPSPQQRDESPDPSPGKNRGHFKTQAKKILYMLYKKPNRELWEFSNGRGGKGKEAAKKILQRFKKKGLVRMIENPGGNKYYLTDEGDKVAKPIVEVVDECKRW